MAAATLSVRPNRPSPGSPFPRPSQSPIHLPNPTTSTTVVLIKPRTEQWRNGAVSSPLRRTSVRAGSRAADEPFEMSVENALKLLGVSEGASFDDILRAKNSILASCKDDLEAIAQWQRP